MNNPANTASVSSKNSTNVRAVPWPVRALRAGFRTFGPIAPSFASRVALRVFTTPPRYVPTERERFCLAHAERTSVPFGHHRLAVYWWGAGPIVLLVHGWGGAAAQFARFVPSLVSQGFRVVALDGLGHGASTGDRSSMPEHGASVAAVARTLGPVHAVIAHSMGAGASRLAEARGLVTERRVYLAGAADVRDVTSRFARLLEVPTDVREEMEARLEARFLMNLDSLSLPDALVGDTTPTLVMHDVRDREVPFEDAEAIVRALPHAEFVRTEGLGHAKLLRDEATIERVLGFVSRGELPVKRWAELAA